MNSTQKGNQFEENVFEYLRVLIRNGEFPIKEEFCKIYWKRKYFSRIREKDIEFDIAIEVLFPGCDKVSFIFLIECKNYNHSVGVDDVEEFKTKIEQVTGFNVKGIIATASSFQASAKKVAEHYKLGHLRHFPDAGYKWELPRAPSAMKLTSLPESQIEKGFLEERFDSAIFDYFFWTAKGYTNSVYSFFHSLISDSISRDIYDEIRNERSATNRVPFLSKAELDGLAANILDEIGYKNGIVVLRNLHKRSNNLRHIKVNRNLKKPDGAKYEKILARADFRHGIIDVYKQGKLTLEQERFTIAHEFSHFLLGHGTYIRREMCEAIDFDLLSPVNPIPEIIRMEFQANYLSSSILMPNNIFYHSFLSLAREYRIYRGDKAELYVDNQSCNISLLMQTTTRLAQKFAVSRRMAEIRLESMGLLNDVRLRGNTIKSLFKNLKGQD